MRHRAILSSDSPQWVPMAIFDSLYRTMQNLNLIFYLLLQKIMDLIIFYDKISLQF